MAGGYLYGWNSDPEVLDWVKIQCDADGYLRVDPSELFENPPAEDEAKKGPSSEWAYDHWKDAAAHHAKYTDVESRAAIGDLFNNGGVLLKTLNCNAKNVSFIGRFSFINAGDYNNRIYIEKSIGEAAFGVKSWNDITGYGAVMFRLYDGAVYRDVCTEIVADSKISTHTDIVDAHHAKYTDLEAQEACNLDGSLYWSCPGLYFDTIGSDINNVLKQPDGSVDINAADVDLFSGVSLPHGATVTGAVVRGNAAAQSYTWYLMRSKMTDLTVVIMAQAVVNTEDTSIVSSVLDNSLYSYFLVIEGLSSTSAIYGARITYTL